MNLEKLLIYYDAHRGGIIGTAVGFIIAVLILLIGFFKVLFIALFAGVGYYVGKRIHDDKDYIKNLLDRVLPPGTYR
jgi:uncharacterized membrane protein